jgi:esterase/lipase superfamily enzyme
MILLNTQRAYDDDVYFNSPMHYMPNLTDHDVLENKVLITCIYLAAVALMKTQTAAVVLQEFFMIKRSIMNWIFGDRNGRMTGIHGEQFYHII